MNDFRSFAIKKMAIAECVAGGFDPYERMTNDAPRWTYYVPGVTAAADALQDAGLLAEWRPIETAPRGLADPYDKSVDDKAKFVLVWNGYHAGVAYCTTDSRLFLEGEDESGSAWLDEVGEPVLPTPTHWMPLPPPPAERDDG